MTPEISDALSKLALAILGATTLIVPTLVITLRTRIQLSNALAPRREALELAKDETLLEISKDCMDRVERAAAEYQAAMSAMMAAETAHEQDRQRWIHERNELQKALEACRKKIKP